jgi:SHS2 domain-containing protein
MKKFEFLSHTADFKIRIYGKNLLSLINNTLLAFKSFLAPKLKKRKKKVKIKVEGRDPISTLIDFFSEVLAKTYIEKTIFVKFQPKILEEKKIEGELEGFEFESLKKDIKSVTYHQAKLEKNKNYLIFEFVIDI